MTSSKPLRPGDSYQALVYVPAPERDPAQARGRRLPRLHPGLPRAAGAAARLVRRPRGPGDRQAPGPQRRPSASLPYGTDGGAGVVWPSGFGDPAGRRPGHGRLALRPALRPHPADQARHQDALRLRAGRPRPRADRAPPTTRTRRSAPTRSRRSSSTPRAGYCQQFSGVMALMLRMGGVPARVASGFSPGSYNSERKDYVVRDTDAHSWVEAYFPPYGWITFDPTPAASPATSQLDDTGTSPNGGPTLPPNFSGRLGQSGDRPFAPGDPGAGLAPTRRGRRLEAARRRRARRPHGPLRRRRALAPAHAVRDARARRRRAAARAAPLRARPVARCDARAPGEPARRLRRRGGLRARGARPPLRALDGAADAPRSAARCAASSARASACAARCARGGRFRRCRRGALKDRLRRPYTPK